MTKTEKKELMKLACKVRMGIIEGTHSAKSGHPGGSLSAADMYTYLYFKEMNVDPEKPRSGQSEQVPPLARCTSPVCAVRLGSQTGVEVARP